MWDESLVLGTRSFRSRLVVGAERYPSAEIMRQSLKGTLIQDPRSEQ